MIFNILYTLLLFAICLAIYKKIENEKFLIKSIITAIISAIIVNFFLLPSISISNIIDIIKEHFHIEEPTTNCIKKDNPLVIITNVNNNTYEQQDSEIFLNYNFEDMSKQELLRIAKTACLSENFDYAYDIYTSEILKDNQVALINLGYIYANGLSYIGTDYQKAEECYIKADCIEAKRNLLALYLDSRKDKEKINELINDLLWQNNDELTWNYMFLTVYDILPEMNIQDISKEKFEYDINLLFEWNYTEHHYEGATPPRDTIHSRWIPTGVKWINTIPYSIYVEQQIKYSKYLDILSNTYYEENNKLLPLMN